MYNLKELTYSGFAEKITILAEENKVGVQVMVGACLMILRGLYATLPKEIRQDYTGQLHRFVNELEHQNPRITR